MLESIEEFKVTFLRPLDYMLVQLFYGNFMKSNIESELIPMVCIVFLSLFGPEEKK